ncbi:MAG: LytTR family DNA-binding domain-containing protein [Pseudomonadota bacterium]
MTALRTLIVDDEPLARDLLRAILQELGGVEVVSDCRNGAEAIASVQDQVPDLMFLDVEMPGMNGFDVIAAIQADILPRVVFTTAWGEYAVDAFRVNALDYLLKPLDEQAVSEALARARSAMELAPSGATKPEMLSALTDVSARIGSKSPAPSPQASLLVRESDRLALLRHEDIHWVEAAGDYVCVHARGETHVMRATLKSVEGQLSADNFVRIHRSSLVNLAHMEALIPAPRGEGFALMSDGKRLKVSRGHCQALKGRLSQE